MADKKKDKQRRIKGDAYWKLNGYLKKTQKLQGELGEWQTEKAEEAGVYSDLINWLTGAIFADTAEIRDGVVRNGQIVGRMEKEVLEEYREKTRKLKELQDEITAYRDKLAKVLKVWPEQIDWKTGKIDSEEFDPEDLPADLDEVDSADEAE